jgi:hypothetical protein
MLKRLILTTALTLCVGMVGLAAAAEVTFVLNNGERHTGQLVYHRDANIGLIQNGRERSFPASDVAVILYSSGDPSGDELSQLPTSDNPPELERHTLVLRNGRVLHGKVYHWESDKVLFDTTSGRGDYSANDIARLYLTGPRARNVFNNPNPSVQATTGFGRGRGRGRGRGMGDPQATVRVEANRDWTDSGLVVQRGEQIAFSTTGTVNFGQGQGMSAGPDGNSGYPGRSVYPVRNMAVGGLIGRVGNGAPFAIGSTSTPIPMPAAGRLMIGVNDDDHRDNTDGFDVQVYRR